MADKVLVVDDEKLIVKGIKYSLEQDGMEVSCAYDGREALDLIKADKILPVLRSFVSSCFICLSRKLFTTIPLTARSGTTEAASIIITAVNRMLTMCFPIVLSIDKSLFFISYPFIC